MSAKFCRGGGEQDLFSSKSMRLLFVYIIIYIPVCLFEFMCVCWSVLVGVFTYMCSYQSMRVCVAVV